MSTFVAANPAFAWRKCRATAGISSTGMRPSTRQPLTPRYVSSVDSGNLAASLATLRQGCLLLLQQPILEQGILDGLRDHVLRLRDEVPYESRTFSTMKLFGSLLRQLECQPKDLFFWEAVLTESRDLVRADPRGSGSGACADQFRRAALLGGPAFRAHGRRAEAALSNWRLGLRRPWSPSCACACATPRSLR